jgi:hypothetical protein
MDCLTDYIGLRGCCNTEPLSGLYINSLPGITNEMLNAITPKEDESGKAVWRDVQAVAARKLYTDAITKLRTKYTLKSVKEFFKLTASESEDLTPAVAGESRGLYLQFAYHYFSFQSFTLARVHFFAPVDGSVRIVVLNKAGTELYGKDVNVVAGHNSFLVDRVFAETDIFIGIQSDTYDTADTDFTEIEESCFCQTVSAACCGYCEPTIGGYVYGANEYQKTAGNGHGVGIEGFVSCDYSSLICYNKELFSSAWLYLLGVHTILELLYSPRINKQTMIDRERYVELRDHYQVEYERQLEAAIEGVRVNVKHDCCVECNEPIKRVEWLP